MSSGGPLQIELPPACSDLPLESGRVVDSAAVSGEWPRHFCFSVRPSRTSSSELRGGDGIGADGPPSEKFAVAKDARSTEGDPVEIDLTAAMPDEA